MLLKTNRSLMNSTFTKRAMLLGAAGVLSLGAFAQQPKLRLDDATVVSYHKVTALPSFIKFPDTKNIKPEEFPAWAAYAFNLPQGVTLKAYKTDKDDLGFTHIRYKEYVNDVPVEGSMVIAHCKNGRVISLNGDYYNTINPSQSPAISEQAALASALRKVNAQRYKWENKEETAAMAEATGNPDFSYLPKGELVFVHKRTADYSAANIVLAYKFNIYAEKPLSRTYELVDANTGEVISEEQIIHTADVLGSANTKFSGTQPMTSDNYGTATQYRLRESGRGLGIETYNLSTSTTYSNTDFTNTSSTWNLTGTNQASEDAHWGAEATYDYYMGVHSLNSIDGAGMKLLSYVHYDVNYVNAFWDGARMTYGDGKVSSGFLIMTALDVCGHEITHGLTSNTAALDGGGTGEPDALNEGFSDIFGTTIEAHARPAQHDWIIGADITCTSAGVQNHVGIRNMSNPNAFHQPDTYNGTYWDNTGEPHTNNGPSIFWYYLLCQGGSGTNDNGDAYSVTGISMDSARYIAFRGLTNYFTPSTDYSDARTYTIQAATDIYGGCSPQVIATTNAWHAVGVGPVFSATVDAAFTSANTTSCNLPFHVAFSNTSTNSSTAAWDFGDGGTSSAYNASHTYTAAGTYNVTLKVGGACGTDSVLQNSYITINPPPAPAAAAGYSCTSPSTVTLSATGAGTLDWYTNPTGGASLHTGATYTTPSLSASTTYYVASQVPGATGNVGPASTSIGGGGLHNNSSTQYIIFDVLQACTLQTVLVNSGAAGTRNVLLMDNTGATIQTIPVAFTSGTGTVTLNLHLTPGTGYRLGGTMMNLYRNNSGASYPYTLAGSIQITGSSAGADYYYYFYNWQVQNDPCTSARTAVPVSIGSPTVSYVSSIDSLCASAAAVTLTGGAPAGGTYSGTGVSGGSFDPSIAGAGNQMITYTYADANGCSSSATQSIYVDPCTVTTGIDGLNSVSGIAIYPNPTEGAFTLELGMVQDAKAELRIVNPLGQTIVDENHSLAAGNNKLELNLNGVAKGIYIVQLKTASGMITRRVTKQ